jgi:hypothetical protein
VNDPEFNVIAGHAAQRLSQSLDGALDIGLEHDAQLFNVAGFDLAVEFFQRDLARLDQFGFTLFAVAVFRDLPSFRLVGHRDERIARLGHSLQTEDLHGNDGGAASTFAVTTDHRTHSPGKHAGKGVADPQRPLLHQHRGHRAAPRSSFASMIVPRASFSGLA